ncbi:MAG: NTP transferase domain-containing protein, partial [Prevotella sp.]|nr:NTP transferase domain-containing protein [Prevotella sp.]
MKYAIIAAGEGSRLAQEGVSVPKPLIKVMGEHLIDRLIRIFMHNAAEEIVVICNDHSPQVVQHLRMLQEQGLQGQRIPLRVVVKSTPSSMHSFYEMSEHLQGGPFVLTTVDTVFDEAWFGRFIDTLSIHPLTDGHMVVTPYEDDEKPLYVETDARLRITGFYDERPTPSTDAKEHRCYISGGIYALKGNAIDVLHRCVERGESRMRNFQRALVSEGFHLQAWVADKVLDIDHAEDIKKAETFLRTPRLHLAWRNGRPSVGQGVPDDDLLYAAARELHRRGFEWSKENIFDSTEGMPANTPYPQVVLSMSRHEEELARLQEYEQQGAWVVNRPQSVRNCTRGLLDELMRSNHISMPPRKGNQGYWVKRADVHSLGGDDVVYCPNEDTRQETAQRFLQETGFPPVVSAHVEGQLVKFYGVGSRFFRCYTKSKEGATTPLEADELTKEHLKHEAQRLAVLTGLDVWGGDAILSPLTPHSSLLTPHS